MSSYRNSVSLDNSCRIGAVTSLYWGRYLATRCIDKEGEASRDQMTYSENPGVFQDG
jgi:hypothetical protein